MTNDFRPARVRRPRLGSDRRGAESMDGKRLTDELVPCGAEVGTMSSQPVKTRFGRGLSRGNRQTFSTGFSSGERGGGGGEMFLGTTSAPARCHAALVESETGVGGATMALISARGARIVGVSRNDMTSPAPLPWRARRGDRPWPCAGRAARAAPSRLAHLRRSFSRADTEDQLERSAV